MELFEVVITKKASSQLHSYADYIRYTLLNEDAAKNLIVDAHETVKKLTYVAASLPMCQHPMLKKYRYRIIHFKTHQYKIVYRIENNMVKVDAI